MRGFRFVCAVAGLLACLGVSAQAQVLNLNPTYFAQYYWDTTSSTFLPCPNASTAEPSTFTPQSISIAGLNPSLNQWTPNVGISSCLLVIGTVLSVGLALPSSVFSISGSPVTGSGTLTGSFINQSANTVFAGPAAGSPGTPSFRALVATDIPQLAGSPSGSAQFNNNGSFGGNSNALVVEGFPGSTALAKINACFAAVPAGGTCDASSLGDFSLASSITLPIMSHLRFCGIITLASGTQVLTAASGGSVNNQLEGCNEGTANINGTVTNGGVVVSQGDFVTYDHFTVSNSATGATAYDIQVVGHHNQTFDHVHFAGATGGEQLYVNGSYYDEAPYISFEGIPSVGIYMQLANGFHVTDMKMLSGGAYGVDIENTQGFSFGHVGIESVGTSAFLFGNSVDGPVSGSINGGYIQPYDGTGYIFTCGTHQTGIATEQQVTTTGLWNWGYNLGTTGQCYYITNYGGTGTTSHDGAPAVNIYGDNAGAGSALYHINMPVSNVDYPAGIVIGVGSNQVQWSLDYSAVEWDVIPSGGIQTFWNAPFWGVSGGIGAGSARTAVPPNNSSTLLGVQGHYAASGTAYADTWGFQDVLGTGASPTSTLTLSHNVTGPSTGATAVYLGSFPITLGGILSPALIYSHAGTQLAACASTTIGTAWVSDAVALTPGTAYSPSAGAGTDTIQVQCTYTGSAYAWRTM